LPERIEPLAEREVRVYTLHSGDNDVARDTAKRILARLIDQEPASIAFDTGEKGKPYLRNDRSLYFSISHSHDVSMIAVTRVADVGVDIEQIRTVPNAAAILRRFFSQDDASAILNDVHRDLRFAEAWTRAEATVKVRGASVWEAATPDPSVTVRALHAPDGFAAAIAVASPTWDVTQVDQWIVALSGDDCDAVC
jgi:4'-phosphopantetheinyl transferase